MSEWKCDRGSRKEKELYTKQKVQEKFHDLAEQGKRADDDMICYCEKLGLPMGHKISLHRSAAHNINLMPLPKPPQEEK